jgi:chemotaxis response regulator CheB
LSEKKIFAIFAGSLLKSRKQQKSSPKPIPIVGLGDSAGGLEALATFFRHVPPLTGCLGHLQHLSPGRTSILGEILQRDTPMKVLEVQDGMAVASDRVYFTPPSNASITPLFRNRRNSPQNPNLCKSMTGEAPPKGQAG